jgi:hypothetical protein
MRVAPFVKQGESETHAPDFLLFSLYYYDVCSGRLNIFFLKLNQH